MVTRLRSSLMLGAVLACLVLTAPAGAGETCEGDINGDATVDFLDLIEVLSSWGECPKGESCPADLNGDDLVDFGDLLVVISNLGPCGEPECDSHEACDDGDPDTLDLCFFGTCYHIAWPGGGGGDG